MNKKILIITILLTIIGVLMIYSSSEIWAEYKFGDSFRYLKYQGMFGIVGLFIMLFLSKINLNFLKKKSNLIFFGCVILLILVLIPGIGTVRNGSRSWFGLGGFGIQPSEFMKIALIIFTSKYLEKNKRDMKNIKTGVFPILFLSCMVFGLIMLQPDLGTGVIIMVTIIAMLFISGVKISFFASIGMVGILGIIGLILIAPYRINRILSFIDPWKDPLGTGFQIIQSLYAIGPGGLFGLGFGNSRQKHFYLPEPQTDFIFSIICEELGFFGSSLVVILFFILAYEGFKVARKCNDLFKKYLAFGITFCLIFQATLNLMVVVGLIPVTGVTLPFLSYGGSSLLISMASIGILLNISRKKQNIHL